MKALISAIVLFGFVGIANAQEGSAPAEGNNDAAMTGAENREPAKSHKKSKKKKHHKKHKTNN